MFFDFKKHLAKFVQKYKMAEIAGLAYRPGYQHFGIAIPMEV